MRPAPGEVRRELLAAALAEFPNSALVRDDTARLRRLQDMLAMLDPGQLAAVERVVEAILDNRGDGT